MCGLILLEITRTIRRLNADSADVRPCDLILFYLFAWVRTKTTTKSVLAVSNLKCGTVFLDVTTLSALVVKGKTLGLQPPPSISFSLLSSF